MRAKQQLESSEFLRIADLALPQRPVNAYINDGGFLVLFLQRDNDNLRFEMEDQGPI